MRVIVGCEFSQVVTLAFRSKGHEAYSCDLIPCEGGHPEWHIQDDILKVLKREKFDLGIFHPPCTYLTYAGTRSWNDKGRLKKRIDALNFFAQLWLASIEKICIENPMGCASPTIAKYSQIIQPYYFGDAESKRTCLWLKNLPKLKHYPKLEFCNVDKSTYVKPKIYGYYKKGRHKGEPIYRHGYLASFKDRGKERSKTFQGIANAMANQWG